MKYIVYVVLIEDRHADTDAQVFFTELEAITWARAKAKEYCHHEQDYEEVELNKWMKKDDWLFFVRYSCEGDSVRVMKREYIR
jgi:hypothetical protein